MPWIPALERWLPSVTYAPDKQIFQQGDPVGFVRLVVSGIAKLSVPSKNRALLLAVRTSGSVLGGVPAVLGGDQIVTARSCAATCSHSAPA